MGMFALTRFPSHPNRSSGIVFVHSTAQPKGALMWVNTTEVRRRSTIETPRLRSAGRGAPKLSRLADAAIHLGAGPRSSSGGRQGLIGKHRSCARTIGALGRAFKLVGFGIEAFKLVG